jgi:hypothetical protein
MKGILLLVGLVTLGIGCWFMYQFMYAPPDVAKTDLIYGGLAFAVALVCLAVFFFKKFREEGQQDISITKF